MWEGRRVKVKKVGGEEGEMEEGGREGGWKGRREEGKKVGGEEGGKGGSVREEGGRGGGWEAQKVGGEESEEIQGQRRDDYIHYSVFLGLHGWSFLGTRTHMRWRNSLWWEGASW